VFFESIVYISSLYNNIKRPQRYNYYTYGWKGGFKPYYIHSVLPKIIRESVCEREINKEKGRNIKTLKWFKSAHHTGEKKSGYWIFQT
jgi:hypothetical protein